MKMGHLSFSVASDAPPSEALFASLSSITTPASRHTFQQFLGATSVALPISTKPGGHSNMDRPPIPV